MPMVVALVGEQLELPAAVVGAVTVVVGGGCGAPGPPTWRLVASRRIGFEVKPRLGNRMPMFWVILAGA